METNDLIEVKFHFLTLNMKKIRKRGQAFELTPTYCSAVLLIVRITSAMKIQPRIQQVTRSP